MTKWLITLVILFSASSAVAKVDVAFPPVTSGPDQVVDFYFQDFGAFINDNATSGAIFRLIRSAKGAHAELYTIKGIPMRSREKFPVTIVDGQHRVVYVLPRDRKATVQLEPVAGWPSVYRVTSVQKTPDNFVKNLILKEGQTINFASEGGGFDLHSEKVVEVFAPDGRGSWPLNYVEAQIPEDCSAQLSGEEEDDGF